MKNEYKEPLVTIGLPCYNVEKYIEFSILSILNQSYQNWELIIIDDNSTDTTAEIIDRFKDNSKIKIHKNSLNKGLVFNLNKIIELSKGKYIARMDPDDIMDRDRLKIQIYYLEINSHIDVISSYGYSIDENNNIHGLRKTKLFKNKINLLYKNCFIHPSVTAKRDWYIDNQYNSAFERVEDHELWLRTSSYTNFLIIKLPLIFYREIGIESRSKYIKSKLNSILFLKFTNISIFYRLIFILIELLKILIFISFDFLNLRDKLIKKRSKILTTAELEVAKNKLNKSINIWEGGYWKLQQVQNH